MSLRGPPRSPLTLVWALENLDPASFAYREHPHELKCACGTRAMLPTSYTLSPNLSNIGPDPFASGTHNDVRHGALDGCRVGLHQMRMNVCSGRSTKDH